MDNNHGNLCNELIALVFRVIQNISCQFERNGVGSERGEQRREWKEPTGVGGTGLGSGERERSE